MGTTSLVGKAASLDLGPTIGVGWANSLYLQGAPWTDLAVGGFQQVSGTVHTTDGTRWVVTGGDNAKVLLYHRDTSSWISEDLGASSTTLPRMVVGGDDTIYVVYFGEPTSGDLDQVILAKRTSTGTISTKVIGDGSSFDTDIGLTLVNGQPWVAWFDKTNKLEVAMGNNDVFTTEVVDATTSSDSNHGVDIAADASGTAHIAYTQDSQGSIAHAVRNAGAWQTEVAAHRNYGGEQVRLAIAQSGDISIAYQGIGPRGLGLATRHAGHWWTQPLTGLSDAKVALAYDATDKLVAVIAATSGVRLFTRAGNFPASYLASCAAVGTATCAAGCQCGTNDCCYENALGSQDCGYPQAYCETEISIEICGDASQDPAAIANCETELPSLTCDGKAAKLPSSCPFED